MRRPGRWAVVSLVVAVLSMVGATLAGSLAPLGAWPGGALDPLWVAGAGVAIFVVGLVATIVLGRMAIGRMLRGEPDLASTGRRGTATILEARPTGSAVSLGGSYRALVSRLRLKVELPGQPPYEVWHRAARYPWQGGFPAGVTVPCFVHPTDRERVHLAWEEGLDGGASGPAGAATVTINGQPVAAAHLPPDLAGVVRQALAMVGRMRPGMPVPGVTAASPGTGPAPPVARAELASRGLAGRAIVHGHRDLDIATPAGRIVELDLEVTVPERPAYRVVTRGEVPASMGDLLTAGMTVPVRVDADEPSRVLVLWS